MVCENCRGDDMVCEICGEIDECKCEVVEDEVLNEALESLSKVKLNKEVVVK